MKLRRANCSQGVKRDDDEWLVILFVAFNYFGAIGAINALNPLPTVYQMHMQIIPFNSSQEQRDSNPHPVNQPNHPCQ